MGLTLALTLTLTPTNPNPNPNPNQADDVAVWAFGAVTALQLTRPLHPLTPESFEPAALRVG